MAHISRRTFAQSTAGAAAALALTTRTRSGTIAAQDDYFETWKAETLQVMAPASPGGGWDTTAREIQRNLQEEDIVETVEVFNVSGAGGTIGLSELATQHNGDGHMLMVMGLVMIGGIGLNESPVGLDQSTPIARLTAEYEVIVVPAASEIQDMAGLMEQFSADPGSVSWAGGSAGGTDHLLVGLIAQAAGIDPTQINYVAFSGGGEALSSLLGGQTTAGVSGLGEFLPQIESGELRALAVSGRGSAAGSPEASPAADDGSGSGDGIPTLQESGIDVELANWRGIVAPPELSDEDAAALEQAITEMRDSETWKQTLVDFGWDDFFAGREEFTTFIESETERVNEILTELQLLGG